MATPHGVVLMVHRFPARRIPNAALSDFRHVTITRNHVSPNPAATDEPPRRPIPRLSSAFYDGEVMIIDGMTLPTEETPAPTPVHGLSEEAVSRLMKTEAAGPDSELCAVCQENYGDNQRVGVLRCRHRFHADCIGKWLQIKNVCPLCNAVGAV